MSRATTNQKLQYCRTTRDSLYQMWKQFVNFQIAISQSRKQQYFNLKFNDILKAFLADKPDAPCDENILSDFLEWVEKQLPISNLDVLAVFDPKSALLWDCYLYLGQGRNIDKKIRDKYKVGGNGVVEGNGTVPVQVQPQGHGMTLRKG